MVPPKNYLVKPQDQPAQADKVPLEVLAPLLQEDLHLHEDLHHLEDLLEAALVALLEDLEEPRLELVHGKKSMTVPRILPIL